MNKEIEKALRKAIARSTHKRYMTGCVIVSKSGEIVSAGCAHASNFRLRELHSIHAEIHALGRARHIDLSNAIAYVGTCARKSGNVTLSAPCLTCAVALRAAGIKLVYYTVPAVNHFRFFPCDLEADLSNLKVYPSREECRNA